MDAIVNNLFWKGPKCYIVLELPYADNKAQSGKVVEYYYKTKPRTGKVGLKGGAGQHQMLVAIWKAHETQLKIKSIFCFDEFLFTIKEIVYKKGPYFYMRDHEGQEFKTRDLAREDWDEFMQFVETDVMSDALDIDIAAYVAERKTQEV